MEWSEGKLAVDGQWILLRVDIRKNLFRMT
jgi:hypothetical protein